MDKDSKFTRDDEGYIAVRVVTSTEALPAIDKDYLFARDENGNIAMRVVGAGGGGGGGSVDYTKVVSKTNSMPVAGADNENMIYLYDGATNTTYTHGYIYENKKTATYTGTVSFESATLSGTSVTCSGNDFINTMIDLFPDIELKRIAEGTMEYLEVGDLWKMTICDMNGKTLGTYQQYTADWESKGFTFTGTPEDGDVVAFTCTIEESAVAYNWVRIDVQPQGDSLPDQTGNAGKFLKTDGETASWENTTSSPATAPTLVAANWSSNTQTITVQGVTANNTVIVGPIPTDAQDYADAGILCTGQALNSLTFTCVNVPATDLQVNIVIM